MSRGRRGEWVGKKRRRAMEGEGKGIA